MITIKKDVSTMINEKFTEVQFNENSINCITEIKYCDTKEIISVIQFGYQENVYTYDNPYEYLKENLNNFTEYIDKYNKRFLINENRIAYIEKHNFGIVIYFESGFSTTIELN